jgi:hypothetical protein
MDDDNNIAPSTLRVLASLIVLALDVAREKAADIVERLRPLVEPPEDLRVHSIVGTLYSGIIIVERGDVVAGIVVMTGQRTGAPSLVTPPPRPAYDRPRSPFSGITDDYARRDGRLPGWADDPRADHEEDEPWRRR